MAKRKDLDPASFELEFISDLGNLRSNSGRMRRYVSLMCPICEEPFTGVTDNLKKAKSCKPCQAKRIGERTTTHGMYKHALYNIWQLQKKRVLDLTNMDYGGRGISMCDSFLNSFEAWVVYVESLPNYVDRARFDLTLDRINNDGNYEPGNLRWATKREQANNKRMYKNNTSGNTNISFIESCVNNPWQLIRTTPEGETLKALYFPTEKEAINAYRSYKKNTNRGLS